MFWTKRKKNDPALFFAVLLIALVFQSAQLFAQPTNDTDQTKRYLAIYHIDVGQGDATLIVGPNGKTLLIDSGNRGKGNRHVVPFLDQLGIDQIDYVMASHYHADHIAGLSEVLSHLAEIPQNAPIDRGTETPSAPTTGAYQRYADNFEASRDARLLGPADDIDLGGDVHILVVASNGCTFGGDADAPGITDENAIGVGFVLNFGEFDYFIGGDMTGGGRTGSRQTADIETAVAPVVGNVDVLKVNHHGSNTSSNEEFLDALKPDVAVISVGNGGQNKSKYLHPRRAVLDRLADLADRNILQKIYLTREGHTDNGMTARHRELSTIADGNVSLFTDGKSYTVNGVTYQTDGRQSGAFRFRAAQPSTCNA